MRPIKQNIELVHYLDHGYELEDGDKVILKAEYVGKPYITIGTNDDDDVFEHPWKYVIQVEMQIIKQPNTQNNGN